MNINKDNIKNTLDKLLDNDYIKILLFLAIYTICFCIFFNTLKYTLPFIIALMVSNLLEKPTKKLKDKLHINSGISSLLMVVLFYGIGIFIVVGIITILIFQLKNVLNLMDATQLFDLFKNTSNQAVDFYNKLDPNITEFINSNFSKTTSTLTSTLSAVGTGVINGSLSILGDIPYVVTMICFAIISNVFILKNKVDGIYEDRKIFKSKWFNILKTSKDIILRYLSSYILVLMCTFVEVFILMLILGASNAFVISFSCALLEFIPIIGMSIVFLPMAIYYVAQAKIMSAVILLSGYVLICILRHIIEPKIMSKTMNISPLSSIIAIFVGITAGGVKGIVFCIFMVVTFNVFVKPYMKNL